MNQLRGKIAVITGGTRGLGLGIAKAFTQEGAAVVVASRSENSIEKAVAELRNMGCQAEGFRCDIGELPQVEALSAFACEKFGHFDIWVNNGGISCPTGPTVHVPPEMVTSLIRTNIIGAYHGSIVAMRHFISRGEGKLINMVGKGERHPVPLHNAYASSRAWVRNFTMALAQEYKAMGVGVFLLNPGIVETDMLQNLHFIEGYEHKLKVLRVVKRILANPPEVPAQKALWLASSATDGKTGLYCSVIGPAQVFKGLGKELSRLILRQEPPPYNPHIELIKPALDIKIPEKTRTQKSGADKKSYLLHLDEKRLPNSVGNKAMNLWRLRKKGFLIPDTHIVPWDAFLAYQQKGEEVLGEIKLLLERFIDPEQKYAIRSSANLEDSQEFSFAGQFSSVLDVKGVDCVLQAVQFVWDEAQAERLQPYVKKAKRSQQNLCMAVIIQKMVSPVVSGVAFSVNPITSLDEIIVEAVRGRGDLLVQEGVTPLRWVKKWGNWIEQSESAEVALDLIQEVADLTEKISHKFKREVDLEWVYDGEKLYWVQMRDITALAKADIYSNKIAKEMTPGMVKPLDWSVVTPIPSAVWLDFITQVIGKNDITPESLVKAFHYRTYHNLGVFGRIFNILGMPRESLEIMMGVTTHGAGKPKFKPGPRFVRLLPRVVRFAWDKWNFARKAEKDFPQLQAEAAKYSLSPSEDTNEQALYHIIDELVDLNKRTTYNTVLSILLMQVYNGVFRSLLKKVKVDLADFDLSEGMQKLGEYDPNAALVALNQKFLALDKTRQEAVKSSNYQELKNIAGIEDFRQGIEAFLAKFGHMSDRTGVFDTIPWRETPDLILGLVLEFQKPAEKELHKVKFRDLERKGMQGFLLKVFYHRARQFRLFREMYSSLFSYTLMLFRVYYIALGKHLVRRGLLRSSEDIYYLYDQEIRGFVDGKRSGADFENLVIQRKEEMARCEHALLPQVIYGNEAPPVLARSDKKLTGTPTSRGYYTGKLKVVRGLNDFNKLAQGDVLVIPYSDVGWLPLLAKAGAVIAEAGGMLSHSSIVAREYGIPAVVSVNGALQLTDDLVVSIDGYKGEIHVHDFANG